MTDVSFGNMQKCEECDATIGTNEIEKEGWKYLSGKGNPLKVLCPECQKKEEYDSTDN